MSLQNIDFGLGPGTDTGDTAYAAFSKVIANFNFLQQSREVRIGNLWHYPPNVADITQIVAGQEFRGFITANRYVVGKVLDPVGFDVDDPTKAEIYLDNEK